MNKQRLEWIMSGLNQYQLTRTEGQFVKSALVDFDQNHALTEDREALPSKLSLGSPAQGRIDVKGWEKQ